MYEPKDFSHLIGLTGFSDALLKNHFTLYGGYVTNTNKLVEELKTATPGTPQYAELKRHFGWEWNGMRLHELYFENMVTDGKALSESELKKVLDYVWGSFDNWKKDFVACGSMRGIGWVILYYAPQSRARTNADLTPVAEQSSLRGAAQTVAEGGRFFNAWVNEHDGGHLAGAVPILVMDVFEHAFMLDYGLKRADYIEAFMKAIDWSVAEKRLG